MAKIGNYEYPEIGLVESIDLGKKIAREFAGEVSRQGLARSLSMSERGGAFSARLGALRMWGVAGGRSRVRVTRDGLRAVTPLSAKESEDARAALAKNVALFTDLSTRLGDDPYAPERFAVLLEELTGADRTEVARRLALLDRVFSEARPYLPKNQGATVEADSPGQSTMDTVGESDQQVRIGSRESLREEPRARYTSPTSTASSPLSVADETPTDRIELGLPDGKLSLPENLANLDAALTVLWARRQLVAASEAAEGRATPAPPRGFKPGS